MSKCYEDKVLVFHELWALVQTAESSLSAYVKMKDVEGLLKLYLSVGFSSKENLDY